MPRRRTCAPLARWRRPGAGGPRRCVDGRRRGDGHLARLSSGSAGSTSSSTTSASRAGPTIADTSDAEWQEAFDQTLFPAIRASRLAVPHMRRRGGGSIVMIASIWGRESGGRMTYNAVKAAEISLAKSMAQQLARDNIRVNSVAPGSILFPGGSWHRRQQEDPRASRSSSRGSCRSDGSAAPRRSGRSSRSSSRRARAGSAGQVCPLTAASHAPRSDLGTAFIYAVGAGAGPAAGACAAADRSRRREIRTRTVTPSGLSCSPVSCSPAVSECRKNPRRRTRGSAASIFTPPPNVFTRSTVSVAADPTE